MEVVCDECTVDCSALTTENCQTAKPPDMNFITNNNSKLSLHFYYNDFFSRISLNIYLFNVYITYNVYRYEQIESTSWGELNPNKVLSHTFPCSYIDILRAL